MTRLPVRLLALLVLVRAAGFTSIVAVVWFREHYTTGEIALLLTAAGVGSVALPALGGIVAGGRPLRPLLVGTLVVNGVALILLPWTIGTHLALPAAAMFAVGAASSLARSLIGTLITVAAPADRQTRTQSVISWTANIGGVVATGIAGIVASTGAGYAPLLVVEGAVLLGAALVIPRTDALARERSAGPDGGFVETVRRVRFPLLVATAATALMQGMGVQFALTAASPDAYVYAALANVVLLITLQPLALRFVRDGSAPLYLSAGFVAGALTGVATALTDSWLVFGIGWTACELLLTAGMVPTILARLPAAQHVAALGVVGSSWGLTAAVMPTVIAAAIAAVGAPGSWAVFVIIGVVAAAGLRLVGTRHPIPRKKEAIP